MASPAVQRRMKTGSGSRSLEAYWDRANRLIHRELLRLLPPAKAGPGRIHEAMRYAVFGGGKRLRPFLALAACDAAGGDRRQALPAACALEMIHTYSLVHDDLPAMDDDDYRRGRPSCHKAFGEAMGILAGDALLTRAFEVIATQTPDRRLVPALVAEVADGAGTLGMIGGQVLDIEGLKPSPRVVEEIHLRKTAALITSAVRAGAIAARATPARLRAVTAYGRNLGLAFQIVDDILDIFGTREQLGKTPGKDAADRKVTYPAVFGVEASRRRAERHVAAAKRALAPLGRRGAHLAALADFVFSRSH